MSEMRERPHDSTREAPAYVLRRPICGHIVGVTVDEPEHKRDTAKFLAAGVRAGFTVEHVTVGYVRDSSSEQWCGDQCPHSRSNQKRKGRR